MQLMIHSMHGRIPESSLRLIPYVTTLLMVNGMSLVELSMLMTMPF